jgi:D-apiose dehydrogenase
MGYRASEKLKGALIGSGFFSGNHLHAWRDIEGTEIVALCDTDSERLNLTAAEFVIERAYSDAAEMIATTS